MSAPLPLVPRCGYPHCQVTTVLADCDKCKIVQYCSPEHQAADLASHEPPCTAVSKSRENMISDEQRLRSFFASNNITAGGDQGRNLINHTNIYIIARYVYLEQVARIKSYSSVKTQLATVMSHDLQVPGRNLVVHAMAPFLMLRLHKDQDAYDYTKERLTVLGQIPFAFAWRDGSTGWQITKDADCFEIVDYFCQDSVDIYFIIWVALLKTKMLVDLISLQASVNGKEIPANVPAEILNQIRDYIVQSPVVSSRDDIMKSQNQEARINRLGGQVKKLFEAVEGRNQHFWPALLNPGTLPEGLYVVHESGSMSEAKHILKYAYDAWMETSGAIDVVRIMIAKK